MNGAKPKILFVDDEMSVLKSLKRFSRRRCWEAHMANSGEEALKAIHLQAYQVVVSDMRMPGMMGDALLAKIRELSPNTVRVLLTGYADMDAVESAVNFAQIYKYVTKPWDEKILEQVLLSSLDKHRQLSGENVAPLN